jgi:hypothetical protein
MGTRQLPPEVPTHSPIQKIRESPLSTAGEVKAMGFRFRKCLRIFPGLWVNLSKRGGSVGIGGRGATLNIGNRGHMETISAPGTGVNYRTGRRPIGRSSGLAGAQHQIGAPESFHLVVAPD